MSTSPRFPELERAHLEDAQRWLELADGALTHSCDPEVEERASYLFAYAVLLFGRAIIARRLATAIPSMNAGFHIRDDEVCFLHARLACTERMLLVLSEDALDEPRLLETSPAILDLLTRASALRPYAYKTLATSKVDSARLRETIWRVQEAVRDALNLGLEAVCYRPFTDLPAQCQFLSRSENRTVASALRLKDEQNARVGRRGPQPLELNPKGLEWLEATRPVVENLVRKFVQVRMYGGGTTNAELRQAAMKASSNPCYPTYQIRREVKSHPRSFAVAGPAIREPVAGKHQWR